MAASEFETEYETTYQVSESGVTRVSMKVELKNLLSNIYADKFSLSIGNTDLSGITVKDAKGTITPKVVQTQNQTTISFDFNNQVVGKDKVNTFYISYVSNDVANKNGAIWEVNIPPLDSDKATRKQTVILVVPVTFGEPAFISPLADKTYLGKVEGVNVRSYIFATQTLGSKAVSAVFGKTQYLSFDLKYALQNANPIKSKLTIALPMDTNYQKVFIEKIDPPPSGVVLDEDDNWVASYEVDPREIVNIKVEGLARVDFEPKAGEENIDLARYLKPTAVWQSDALAIRNLAGELKSAREIYNYVVDHLSYDYGRIGAPGKRLGALAAFENPLSAICTEFTDLFVALARAAGIPAREVLGFAFTNNDKLRPLSLTSDVLHSWPEYYDKGSRKWIQVDPTWGRTTGGVDYFSKFDLNHFAFVIHGLDPDSPLPAGAYKLEGAKKDVLVSAVSAVEFPKVTLLISEISHNSKEVKVKIKNASGLGVDTKISAKTTPEGIIDYQGEIKLPAYGELELSLPLKQKLIEQTNIFFEDEFGRSQLTINRGGTTKTILVAQAVAGVCLAVGAGAALRLWIRRRKKKPFIYW